MTQKRLISAVAAMTAAAGLASGASAAPPKAIVQGYGSPPATLSQSATHRRPLASAGQRGTLPFTGMDLALLTSGGASMLLLGAGMRRLGRSRA